MSIIMPASAVVGTRYPQNRRSTRETENLSQLTTCQSMNQEETTQLVDGLLSSLASIQTENDPLLLQQKLADHRHLLDRIESRIRSFNPRA